LSYTLVLGVIAVAQAGFFVLVVIFLLFNRARQRAHQRRDARIAGEVSEPLHRWLIGAGPLADVARALRVIPAEMALEQSALIVALRIPPVQLEALSRELHDEAWVRTVLGYATSRFWWKRLEAARMLSVVGVSQEHALLGRLLADPHPAVQTAATTCLARSGNEALVASVVDALPRRPVVVRLYQFGALRECWRLTIPVLLEHLRRDAPAHDLEVWINLAEAIGAPECLAPVLALRAHPEAIVRLGVAKALKKYFHPEAEPALLALLADDDWRVRGQAARALGVLVAVRAIPALADALRDRSWWVRFRSGLALAQMGEPGREALRVARDGSDRFAREMAAMISGLSEGGMVELAEA
jgi:HEAT repeat protein